MVVYCDLGKTFQDNRFRAKRGMAGGGEKNMHVGSRGRGSMQQRFGRSTQGDICILDQSYLTTGSGIDILILQ